MVQVVCPLQKRLFPPVTAIELLQRCEKRVGKKVNWMWSYYYQQSSTGFHKQLVSKLQPSQAGREYNFSQSPGSMGAQKAIVKLAKIVTIESLAFQIKICIGNARAAMKAIFKLHSLWPQSPGKGRGGWQVLLCVIMSGAENGEPPNL